MEYIQKIRSIIGSERVLIPATALVILNKKKEVLLHVRGKSGDWGLPGGLMDMGETVIESIQREAKEETGLEIFNPKLYGVFSGPEFEVDYPNGDKTAPVVLAFYTNEFKGSLTTGPESPKIDFFSFSNLPSKMNVFHDKFVAGFIKYQKTKNLVI